SGEHGVAIKSIENSPYNVPDEFETSEIFREPIALIVSAISCRNDMVNSDVLGCYGLSKNPNTNSYLIITKLCKCDLWRETHDDLYLSVNICNGERPQTAKNVSIPECYKGLMEQCWNNIPSNRPSVNELYEVLRGWRFAGINANQFEDANKNDKNIKIIDPPKQQPQNSRFISTTHLINNIPEIPDISMPYNLNVSMPYDLNSDLEIPDI
ncbi:4183_t:CDS:2, partial [Racocetra persica]